MDSLPGKKHNFQESVSCGSESVDEESIERIKAKEVELLNKLTETEAEKKKIEGSLNLQRERLVNKLKSDNEDLQKKLRTVQAEKDTVEKELMEQKEVVRYSFKEKQQIVEDLEGKSHKLEQELKQAKFAEKRLKEENSRLTASQDNKIAAMEEQFKTAKSTIESNKINIEQLEKEKKDEEDKNKKMLADSAAERVDMEKNFRLFCHEQHDTIEKQKVSIDQLQATKTQLQTTNVHLQRSIAKLEDKLRKSKMETEGWQKPFQQLTEDFDKQQQKSSEEMRRLRGENKQLQYRQPVGSQTLQSGNRWPPDPNQQTKMAAAMPPGSAASMTSQGSYSLIALECEVKTMGPSSIQAAFTNVIRDLQRGKDDTVKTSATVLKKEIDRIAHKGLSEDGVSFLKKLQTYGNLIEGIPRGSDVVIPE